MGFTPFGTVLQMQGGSLQQKLSSVFGEKLKMIKALEGGQLSPSMLTSLLGSSGIASSLSSVLQNPASIISSLTELQSQVTMMLAQVQAASTSTPSGSDATAAPMYPLTADALQAASAAVTSLLANVQGLAGTAAPAPYGPIDCMLHYSSVGNVGDVFPALSFAAATAPLTSAIVEPIVSAALSATSEQVYDLLAAVTTDDAAAAIISTQASNVAAVQSTSTEAISGLQNALTTIATVQAVAALSLDTNVEISAFLGTIVQPEALAVLNMQAEVEYHVDPPAITTLAPLVNQANSVIQGAMAAQGATSIPTEDVE